MTADFLSIEVPVYLAAVGYLWVAVACTLWGIDLIWYATRRPCRVLPIEHHPVLYRLDQTPGLARIARISQRIYCRINSFELWLGLFLIFGDGLLYGILSNLFISDRSDTVPLWAFVILLIGAFTATGAYLTWPTE